MLQRYQIVSINISKSSTRNYNSSVFNVIIDNKMFGQMAYYSSEIVKESFNVKKNYVPTRFNGRYRNRGATTLMKFGILLFHGSY